MGWERENKAVPIVRRPVFGTEFVVFSICSPTGLAHNS